MEIQTEILNAVVSIIAKQKPILPKIKIGPAPINEGVVAQCSAGYNTATYLDGNFRQTLPILFLAKSKDQIRCSNTLNAICNTLQTLKNYPPPNGKWEWVSISTATTPSPVVYDTGGWLYSAVVNVQFETDF